MTTVLVVSNRGNFIIGETKNGEKKVNVLFSVYHIYVIYGFIA
jgi:hypothetical protein